MDAEMMKNILRELALVWLTGENLELVNILENLEKEGFGV